MPAVRIPEETRRAVAVALQAGEASYQIMARFGIKSRQTLANIAREYDVLPECRPHGMKPRTIETAPGDQYGRFQVIEEVSGSSPRKFRCHCQCGTEVVVHLASLVSGRSQSCGCLHTEILARDITARNHRHGMANHPLYATWYTMVRRCTSPASASYRQYGGRGIAVCPEWLDVRTFLSWVDANLGPRPVGHSLDRIDNNGNYEPGNVRWASGKEQNANRRRPVWLDEQHWQVILKSLSETTSPNEQEAYAALRAEMRAFKPMRSLPAA